MLVESQMEFSRQERKGCLLKKAVFKLQSATENRRREARHNWLIK